MSPGAGDELKHLMAGVKSKASKPEGLDLKDKSLDLKPKGNEPKSLSLNDKGLESKDKGLNLKALGEAVKGANSNRQSIAVWSPKISAIMWYLKKTTPEFSISDEARTILEEGLEKKYPELFQKVQEEINQKNKS
jgi:hypothetical protein